MTVYVLDIGEYAQRVDIGVFTSVDAAKARVSWAKNWQHFPATTREAEWWSCIDDGDSAHIFAYVLDEKAGQ